MVVRLLSLYSGHCLKRSWVTVSIGEWNQIYPDLHPQITLSYITYVVEAHSLIFIIRLMVISYGLAQRDPVKWRPLYLKILLEKHLKKYCLPTLLFPLAPTA